MIKYNLICECGRIFESWFSSSAGYENLIRKKLVNCIYCNSTTIKKSIMAPNLPSKSNKIIKKNKFEKNTKEQLLQLRNYIEKNCKDVGDKFPQEARNLYYDNKNSKGIYGRATSKETEELLEEGIEITAIPWINKSEN